MPLFLKGLPADKMQLLFILETSKTELTEQQLYRCVYECTKMNWFDYRNVLGELEKDGDVAFIPRAFGQGLRVTPQGREALSMFAKNLPFSIRETITDYVTKNADQFRREKELVSSEEELLDGGYMVTLRAVEGNRILFEIRLSVASKEEATQMRMNWENASSELYDTVWSRLKKPE